MEACRCGRKEKMTSRNGNSYCDICNIKLASKERYDLYKRRLGSLKISKHYCTNCFNIIIEKLHNKKLKEQYKLLCKGLDNGSVINIGNQKLSVFDAVMLKQRLEQQYGFQQEK